MISDFLHYLDHVSTPCALRCYRPESVDSKNRRHAETRKNWFTRLEQNVEDAGIEAFPMPAGVSLLLLAVRRAPLILSVLLFHQLEVMSCNSIVIVRRSPKVIEYLPEASAVC